MIIEVGFGLCAANLPTLYGVVRTKGMQKLTDRFQSFFSYRSGIRGGPYGSSNKRQVFGSDNSAHPVILSINEPRQSSLNIELATIEHDDRIHVTRTFEWARYGVIF